MNPSDFTRWFYYKRHLLLHTSRRYKPKVFATQSEQLTFPQTLLFINILFVTFYFEIFSVLLQQTHLTLMSATPTAAHCNIYGMRPTRSRNMCEKLSKAIHKQDMEVWRLIFQQLERQDATLVLKSPEVVAGVYPLVVHPSGPKNIYACVLVVWRFVGDSVFTFHTAIFYLFAQCIPTYMCAQLFSFGQHFSIVAFHFRELKRMSPLSVLILLALVYLFV